MELVPVFEVPEESERFFQTDLLLTVNLYFLKDEVWPLF